jgi:hypothetical protein
MHGFRLGRRGIEARLSTSERAALARLLGQLDELLGEAAPEAWSPDVPAPDPDAPDGSTPPVGNEPGPPDMASGDSLDAVVGWSAGSSRAPSAPALARLLPDGYGGDDPEAAAEFRRYTEPELRSGKRAAARAALAGLAEAGEGPLRLDGEAARIWLAALNDVRLVLGTRLGVTEETYDELRQLQPDDPRYPPLAAYDWLTYLQETLVSAVARD